MNRRVKGFDGDVNRQEQEIDTNKSRGLLFPALIRGMTLQAPEKNGTRRLSITESTPKPTKATLPANSSATMPIPASAKFIPAKKTPCAGHDAYPPHEIRMNMKRGWLVRSLCS